MDGDGIKAGLVVIGHLFPEPVQVIACIAMGLSIGLPNDGIGPCWDSRILQNMGQAPDCRSC
jgi:hypothetical protein